MHTLSSSSCIKLMSYPLFSQMILKSFRMTCAPRARPHAYAYSAYIYIRYITHTQWGDKLLKLLVGGRCCGWHMPKANNAAEFIQKLNNKMLIISIVQALSTVDSVEQTVAAKCVNYGVQWGVCAIWQYNFIGKCICHNSFIYKPNDFIISWLNRVLFYLHLIN